MKTLPKHLDWRGLMMTTTETPKNFDLAYPGRFLKAGHIGSEKKTVTITNIFHEVLQGEKGEQRKLIISFEETSFQVVCCKLNGTALKCMFGPIVPEWIGKRITIFATDTLMPFPGRKGTDALCIRIWGSPDIQRDVMAEFRPPKRKALTLHMHATGTPQRIATEPRSAADVTFLVDAIVADFEACSSSGEHEKIRARWMEIKQHATDTQRQAVTIAGTASDNRNKKPRDESVDERL